MALCFPNLIALLENMSQDQSQDDCFVQEYNKSQIGKKSACQQSNRNTSEVPYRCPHEKKIAQGQNYVTQIKRSPSEKRYSQGTQAPTGDSKGYREMSRKPRFLSMYSSKIIPQID